MIRDMVGTRNGTETVPGTRKSPAPAGAGDSVLVAGTGFEPATSGLWSHVSGFARRVVVWVEHAEVVFRRPTNAFVSMNADVPGNVSVPEVTR